MNKEIERGDIYYADLSPVFGAEQGGVRPVLIIQNNVGNEYSPTVIVAGITQSLSKAVLPTHVLIPAETFGNPKKSVVCLEQIRTLDKRRLKEYICKIDENTMKQVDDSINLSFGVNLP